MDAEGDEIAAAQFAVHGEIKQREIAGAMIQLQSNSDGPDLFQLQRRLLTQQFAFVPWYCTFSGLRRHEWLLCGQELHVDTRQWAVDDPKQSFTNATSKKAELANVWLPLADRFNVRCTSQLHPPDD